MMTATKPIDLCRRDWLKSCAAVGMTAMAPSLLSRSPALAEGATPARPEQDSRREVTLFALDEVSIPFTYNLRLTMCRPEKHPDNPLLRRGGSGTPDELGVQFYGSVLRDNGRFRMWYVAIDGQRSLRPAYAESDDGLHWSKPELGLVEHAGSRRNNLLLLEPASPLAVNLKVIADPGDADPARRYKMSVHTWWWDGKRRGAGTLVPLFSPDGLRWQLAVKKKLVNGLLPVKDLLLPRSHFEAGSGLYQFNGMYYVSGQCGPGRHGVTDFSGRIVLVHRSPDFIHWSTAANIGFMREGQHASFPSGEGEESHEGVSVWNRGNVLLGLYGLWHGAKEWKDRTIDLGFLVSNDGVHFREPAREWTFLQRGADGDWDQGGLLQGQGFENVGDQTYIWYGAWDPRVWDPTGKNYSPRGGVGLATLPRDRFASLSPKSQEPEAELITAPVPLTAHSKVFLNVAGLSERTVLRVELLDQRERPLPGYSGDRAAVVGQSGFRCPVVWKGPEQSGRLPESVRIRVFFSGERREQIALYAMYVEG